MPRSLSPHLQFFLISGKNEALLAELGPKWGKLHPDEKQDLYKLLFLSRQDRLFVRLLKQDIHSGHHIAKSVWNFLLFILEQTNVRPPETTFHQWQKVLDLDSLDLDQSLAENARKARFDEFNKEFAKRKFDLRESIKILEREGLHDQKIEVQKELALIVPGEHVNEPNVSEREKRKAVEAIQKHKAKQFGRFSQPRQKTEDLEAKEVSEQLILQARSHMIEGKASPLDFAYMFRSFEEPHRALEFIEQLSESEQKDWQRLDYLLFGDQHIATLDHCDFLKKKYSNNPEALFAIVYSEAWAFWELGEKTRAIDLMSQIATMRPDYKSASETLNQWKHEAFNK